MNRHLVARTLAAAVLLGGVAATAAHARSDVHFSIGVNLPYGYVEPGPVYVAPQPVYVAPRPVYAPPPVVYGPPPVVHAPPRVVYGAPVRLVGRGGPWGDRDLDGIPNRYDPDSRYYQPRAAYRHHHHRHPGWDHDRDGVPNRYDRAPHDPYRN